MSTLITLIRRATLLGLLLAALVPVGSARADSHFSDGLTLRTRVNCSDGTTTYPPTVGLSIDSFNLPTGSAFYYIVWDYSYNTQQWSPSQPQWVGPAESVYIPPLSQLSSGWHYSEVSLAHYTSNGWEIQNEGAIPVDQMFSDGTTTSYLGYCSLR